MSLQLVQHEDKCPDCICMELKAAPVDQSEGVFKSIFSVLFNSVSYTVKQFQLFLNIDFNEHWELLPPFGKIKFWS